jgi:hypothetical protein
VKLIQPFLSIAKIAIIAKSVNLQPIAIFALPFVVTQKK